MVYGIRNVVSEDTRERLDIASAYYNVINEDYTLLGEDYLNEAFDITKIRNMFKDRLGKVVEAITNLITSIITHLQNAVKTIKEAYKAKKFERLDKKLQNIFKDEGSYVTITSPEPNLDPDYNKLNEIYAILMIGMRDANRAFDKSARIYGLNLNKETAEDKLQEIHDELSDVYDKFENKLKEYTNYDITSIFFKDDKSKEIKITANDADTIYIKLIREDANLEQIVNIYKKDLEWINKEYDFAMKDFDDTCKYIKVENCSKEQEASFKEKAIAEFTSCASRILKKCCSANSDISTKMSSAYKNYIDTLSSMIKKILKAGHIDIGNEYKDVDDQFKKAVDEDNLMRVRIRLKDLLLLDKSFKKFDTFARFAEKFLKSDLYVKDNGDAELSEDKADWTEDDINMLIAELMQNFSKEKIALLKKMISYIYADKKEE